MKKLAILFILLMVPAIALAESMILTTYYPAPYGAYDRLRLVPRSEILPPSPCDMGKFYVDGDNGGLFKICQDDGSGTGTGIWGMISGAWSQFNVDAANANIFPNELGRDLKVGIGTSDPLAPNTAMQVDIGNMTNPVDWTSNVGGGLSGDIHFSGQDATLTFIGEDTSNFTSVLKFSEVSALGNYLDIWVFVRGSNTLDESKFHIGYARAAGPVTKWWQGPAAKMTIQKDGKVGFGMTAPEHQLHIKGLAANNGGLITLESLGDVGMIFNNNTLPHKYGIYSNNGQLRFHSDDGAINEIRMALTSDGKVGMGTTAPATQLHVKGLDALLGGEVTLESDGSAGLIFRDTTQLGDELWIKSSDDQLRFYSKKPLLPNKKNMVITNDGKVAVGFPSPPAPAPLRDLHIQGDGEMILENGSTRITYQDTDVGDADFEIFVSEDAMRFQARPDDITPWDTKFSILANGFIGIGTSNPQHPIHAPAYNDAQMSALGIWSAPSSHGYKDNIRSLELDEALQTVNQLEPVVFNYKKDANEDFVGFIAEDVPELIAYGDRKALIAMDIVATLTKVVQYQTEQIERQNEILEERQKLIEELRFRVETF